MYVNLVFAVLAFVGGSVLLQHRVAKTRAPLDIPGAVLVSGGLFGIVYGFAHADTAGWSSPVTIGFLVAGAVLLAGFVLSQLRSANPLLPLRVVLDRNRGGAYLAIFTVGVGMFGVFLFLTYYLQQTLGFSAVKSGLAFLPLTGAVIVMAQIGTNVLTRRIGPRWIVGPGLVIAAVGMWMLTGLDLTSSYANNVLPGLLVFGAGLGLVFSGAMSNATARVDRADAGVASAMVNVGQQVGGSIGTALLNTIAATAATNYVGSHAPSPQLPALAAMHGYHVAFLTSGSILLAGGILAGLAMRSRPAKAGGDQAVAL
jgi:predicted MFS family arabinose efflux permease